MWIDPNLLSIHQWHLSWSLILVKLVIYTISLEFVFIPAIRCIYRSLSETDV